MIDDDPDFLMQQELVLKNAGYDIEMAENAEIGEKMIKKGGMDMIIVDLMLERNDDGFRLCYISKKINSNIPIMMVTGVASETGIEFDVSTDEENAWIKADLLLPKPVRPEQLLEAVSRLIGNKNA